MASSLKQLFNFYFSMKSFFLKIQKTLKFSSLTILCLATFSCSGLSRKQIIRTKKTEAISVLELKILNNGNEEKRNSGVFGECHLVFGNDNGKVRFSNSNDYSFYILKTKPGIVKIKALKCSNWIVYFKNRYLDLDDLEFNAKPDHINYLGNLVINYDPSGFGFLDIFGLGGIVNDNDGSFDIKIYDNTEKSINFLKEYYPELKYKNVVKSIVHQRKNSKAKIRDASEYNKAKKFIFDESLESNKSQPYNQQMQMLNELDKTNFGQQTPSPKQSPANESNDFKFENTQENKAPSPYRQPQATPNQINPNSAVPAVVPVVAPAIQNEIPPRPLQTNQSSVTIPQEDSSSEEIKTNDNNNSERKIGKIIRRNKILRENKIEQPVNNPPIHNNSIQESSSPASRSRPAEVQ